MASQELELEQVLQRPALLGEQTRHSPSREFGGGKGGGEVVAGRHPAGQRSDSFFSFLHV